MSNALYVLVLLMPGHADPIVLRDNIALHHCPGYIAMERRAMLEVEAKIGKPMGYRFHCLPKEFE